MKIRAFDVAAVVVAALLILLAGCRQSATLPAFNRNASSAEAAYLSPASIVHTGRFTEYTLPAHSGPQYVVNGPSDTVWFTQCANTSTPRISSMSATTGVVRSFVTDPVFIAYGSCAIVSAGGKFWFPVVRFEEQEDWLVSVTPSGAFTYNTLGQSGASYRNFVVGSDGRIWFPWCQSGGGVVPCGGGFVSSVSTSFVGGLSAQLPGFSPQFANTGPDKNVYVTAIAISYPTPNPRTAIFAISTAGKIVHQFALPNNSLPSGNRTGPDGNIWIAEPFINKIARMTTAGTLVQFSVPTANAGVYRVTSGADGALWFTETYGNKIGRITTTGAITEYPVPTASARPFGIIPCPTTVCGAHGGVWFTEMHANKIARYDFP